MEINVTLPFIDVMLVLLIVFIIAAPLATTAINVDIAAGGHGPNFRSPAIILIDDRGALSIRSSRTTIPTNLERLARDLPAATRSGAAHSRVVVGGAAHTRYGSLRGGDGPPAPGTATST